MTWSVSKRRSGPPSTPNGLFVLPYNKGMQDPVGKELQQIPGVGPKIADMLNDIGISSIAELKGRSAEDLYERLTVHKGRHIDRCVLYVFREAVYFASHDEHDPDLLKWWNWKDRMDYR